MNASPSALSGLRVIDFGQWLAAPLAAMLLGDFGADVIRVDPPGGPHWNHPANAILQRNKRSITLDLKAPDDLDFARRLISTADVVIDGFRPGTMARLGLDPAKLRAHNDRLIWCAIPGFGHDDPRASDKAWEGIVSAAATLYPPRMFATSGGPRFSAIPYASNFGAFIATHSIVAALIARERYGHGESIEVPLFDAAMEAIAINLEDPASDPFDRVRASMHGAAVRNPADHKLYRAGDGRFLRRDIPLRGMHALWDRFMPPGLKDDASAEGAKRGERMMRELLESRPAIEWERIGQEQLRAAFATHQTVVEWLHDDDALASQSVIEVEDSVLGPTRQAGFGVRVSSSMPAVRFGRRPLGADADEIRREVSMLESKPAASPRETSSGAPLDGIRVIDFTSLVAGPGATRILAEYGADVIKVSKAGLASGKINPVSDEPGMYAGHRTTGAGKKTIFLNLRDDRGLTIAHRLVASADVVSINFARGMADDMGMGEARLRELKSDLIYSTVNVHGRGGWRDLYRGHEQLGQTVTGITIRFGGSDAPEELPILVNDYGTPHLSALGMLIALYQKFRGASGGAQVEAALSRTSSVSQIPYIIDYPGRDICEPTGPEAKGWSAFDRLYACADGWIYLAAIGDEAVSRLRSVPGLEDVGGDEAALEARFRAGDRAGWLARLKAAGVPAQAYLDLDDLLRDPILEQRGLVVRKDHPGMDPGRVIGIAARFDSRPGRSVPAAARMGWHTAEVLADIGMSEGEIKELMAAEVVAGPVADR
jgi:crotonobetainyl-CoA:carnitine CoA-transferase CaiB-like acyl-CoA transferase